MPRPWSTEEVEATVAEYFAMLRKELAGTRRTSLSLACCTTFTYCARHVWASTLRTSSTSSLAEIDVHRGDGDQECFKYGSSACVIAS
jgi:hypothetical protein